MERQRKDIIMQQKRNKNQFWYLLSPIAIKWIVEFLVECIAGLIYYVANFARFAPNATQEETMNQALAMAAELSQYATEMGTAAAIITIPIMAWLFLRDRKKMLPGSPGLEKKQGITPMQYGAIAVLGIASCIALNNLIILSSVSSFSQSYQATAENLYHSPFLMQLIGLGILIPVAEEFIFRGMLYHRMRENMTAKTAILFSAAIFGVMHGNVVQLIYAGITGLLLAYVYEKTGSLKAPVFLHVIMNLTSVIATKLDIFQWMFKNIFILAVATVATAALAAGMFVILKGNKATPEE